MKIDLLRGFANSYLLDGYFLVDATNANFPSGIGRVIITHEHCDHLVGLGDLKPKKIYSSKFVAEALGTSNDSACLCRPLNMKFPAKEVTDIVKEGDWIDEPGFRLRIIETPGHAKGAICIYLPEQRILFSGDTVFPDFAMPRLDLPTSEPEKLRGTYEKLAELEIEVIYSGHGKKTEDKEYIKKLMELL